MTELEKAMAFNAEIKGAIETILQELNQGQRHKLTKSEAVMALLNRYGIRYEE